MIFHKVPDRPDEEFYHLHYSENDKVALWVAPVMFGCRVRVGMVKSMNFYHELDYCGGADQENMEELWSVIKAALENINEEQIVYPPDLSRGWPNEGQRPTKPGYPCFVELQKMAGEYEVEDLPNCNVFRFLTLKKYSNG